MEAMPSGLSGFNKSEALVRKCRRGFMPNL